MRQSLLTAAFAAAVGILTLGAGSAQAALICDACSPLAPATYLGEHDANNLDESTFGEDGMDEGTSFDHFYVFDISPDSAHAASANFQMLSPIDDFNGALYADAGGTTCLGAPGTACTTLDQGGLIQMGAPSGPFSWALFVANLEAGRYILNVFGTAGDPQGTYTGQIGFAPVQEQVPEPALLALLGLGLAAAGTASARRRRRG